MYGRKVLKQTIVRIVVFVQAQITLTAVTETNLKSIPEGKAANPAFLDGSSVISEYLYIYRPNTVGAVTPLRSG
jgi:hypothetical protein